MADAAGNDEELAGTDQHIAAIGGGAADAQFAAENEEHFVFRCMLMPGKFALNAGDLDVLIVDLTHDSRKPQRYARRSQRAAREFKGNRMLLHQQKKLIAEAGGDGDLMAALGSAAAEHGSPGFAGHAAKKAMDLAAATAVGLEGALGHVSCPVMRIFLPEFIALQRWKKA